MIKITNASLSIGKKIILEKVSWEIFPATFNCIVGPNGAGKTSLLKLLTGEIQSDSGEIVFDDKSLGNYKAAELAQKRAVVSQFHDTQFPFKCEEVIEMSFDALSTSDYENANQHKDIASNSMHISSLLPRRFDRLSGGEQQRVMCARALTQLGVANKSLEGKILLLDEPTSNMDIQHQLSFFTLLKKLCLKGLTVATVLHDLDHIYQYADQVILLMNGKPIDAGSAKDTLSRDNIQKLYGINSSFISLESGSERLLVHN